MSYINKRRLGGMGNQVQMVIKTKDTIADNGVVTNTVQKIQVQKIQL